MSKYIWYLLVVVISLSPVLDPDLGWHIRTGQDTLSQGHPPQTDSYSFSLAGHEYIAHSWLQDVILALGYDQLGLLGISLWYSLLVIVLALIWRKQLEPNRSTIWLLLPLLLFTLNFIGLRPHLITMIGMSLIYAYYRGDWGWSQRRWYIALTGYFWLWANMHAGVVLGLGFYGLCWLVWSTGSNMRESRTNLLMGLGLTVVTLINPYTWRIYQFSWQLAQNPWARGFNTDWLPLLSPGHDPSSIGLRLILLISAGCVIIWNKDNRQRILVGLALALTLYSIRFSLVLLVLLIPSLALLSSRYLHNSFGKYLKPLWVKTSITLFIALTSWSQLNQWHCSINSIECYAQLGDYPQAEVEYLAEQEPGQKIFNHYTWGGYLVWQLPQHQVFIDGRMDSFYIETESGETESFMAELVRIEELEPGWQERLDGYQPDYLLFPADWPVLEASGYEGVFSSKLKIKN